MENLTHDKKKRAVIENQRFRIFQGGSTRCRGGSFSKQARRETEIE